MHRTSSDWDRARRPMPVIMPMISVCAIALAGWICASVRAEVVQETRASADEKVLFEDKFAGDLADGWSWEREDSAAWRVADGMLQIRVQPGGMWGGGNNAKNVLVRKMPKDSPDTVAAEVTVSDQATGQYEQAGIAWYYDGGNMIKLVKECIGGKPNVVMGREQNDRTRTIRIVPLKASSVQLRLRATGDQITGQFRPEGKGEWKDVGTCDSPGKGRAKVSLQAYNGPRDAERWARFSGFRILVPKAPAVGN